MAQVSTVPGQRPATYAAELGEAEKAALEGLARFVLKPQEGLPAVQAEVVMRALQALTTAEPAQAKPAPRRAPPADLNDQVANRVREWVDAWPERPDQNTLFRLLKLLAQWRGMVLANTYTAREGGVIHGGLFRGMRYIERPSQGMLMPRLVGNYEAELHPHFEAFIREGLDVVIDVGCAEGYYAVGLARLAPDLVVHAHDIDENARTFCAELARRNEVADRVIIGGEFKPADFQAYAGKRVLVLVDAEGAEVDVLDPAQAPALAEMPIIVETHDLFRPGAEAAMVARFSATHEITRVLQQPKAFDMPAWMQQLTDLDQLLSAWDYRMQPTPWLVMRPRRGPQAVAAA